MALLRHRHGVISHAGSRSVIGALTFGVPWFLLPMGADQPLNAYRCAALRVAEVLDPVTAASRDVAAATTSVLSDPSFRRAAGRLRRQAAAQPTAASWLARLATHLKPAIK